jgi:rod shape-determining protein MreC
MQRLFLLIYTYRTFLVFTGLQITCLWLIVSNNPYQSASFFNTSNHVAGQGVGNKGNIVDYFKLKEINQNLAQENCELREELIKKNRYLTEYKRFYDTSLNFADRY